MLTLDFGKTAAVYHSLKQISEHDRKILVRLALSMSEFNEGELVWTYRYFDTLQSEGRMFLSSMKERGILIQPARLYGCYRIHPFYHLAILLECAGKRDKEALLYLEEGYDDPEPEVFLNRFFDFIGNRKDWTFDEKIATHPDIYPLLFFFPFFEELTPVFSQFSFDLKITLLKRYLNGQLQDLRPVNMEWVNQYYLHNPDFSDEQKAATREIMAWQQEVFPLHADAWRELGLRPSGLTIRALWEQMHDEINKSVALYEEAIKQQNRTNPDVRTTLPDSMFTGFCYGLALIREGSERSKKKIQTLLKKKELKEDNTHFPTYLLLSVATQSVFTHDINRMAIYRVTTPLGSLLYALTCQNYELPVQDVPHLDEALYLVRNNQFRLLWAEAARFYPELKKDLLLTDEGRALTPLFPQYIKLKPWEIILQKLLTDPAVNPQKEMSPDKQTESRIIYLMTRHYDIIPVLQKSKAGDTWKGGRKIAIKSFAEGISEMNDTDTRVAATVRRYPASRGYSYDYFLGGERTLAVLAGYPLVFAYANPDIPIEIVKSAPYISITKRGDSFQIETNVPNPDDNSLIRITEENEHRLNVIELTSKQIYILHHLLRLTEYPAEAEPLLKELLNRIGSEINIHSDLIDNQNATPQIAGDTTPIVQIMPLGESFKAEIFVKPLGDYPPYCKPAVGNRSVMGSANGHTTQAVRNFKQEAAQAEIALQLFREIDPDASDVLILPDTSDCLELLEQLYQLKEAVRIEWPEGEKMKIHRQASSSGFSITVKGENRWFEIDGSLRISKDEEMNMLELIRKVAVSESRFIRLEGDHYLAITEQLRRQLIELNSLLHIQKGKLLLSEFAAPFLEGLDKGGVSVTRDTVYCDLMKRVESASKNDPVIPTMLQATLREYQEEGFKWMMRLSEWGAGACLADDMGLGKTVQAIAVILAKAQHGAALVIAPASVLSNWESEITRFAPALTVKNLNASADRDSVIEEADRFDIVITTYGLLISEEKKLTAKNWNTVVLDEAHTIKNRETKMSKAAMRLKSGFRMILTGTPLQNHLSEIWNLFEFINPGLLGSFQLFSERFIMPIELRQDKAQQRLLKKILSPFILRRTKNEVLHELPGKTEIILPVELSRQELMFYETMRRKAEMSLQSGDLNAVKTLAEITRLRQAACHPAIVRPGYEGGSSKSDVFMELVHELTENNHRALVFSQFTSHLALIRQELDRRHIEYLYLDGSTPTAQRSKLVKSFQTGNQPLFLISLKAGGLGLNLTAADYIIHLDPWWNPAVEDQASDRAYRIGQTRPVTVYRLIARHTIEEKIIELHHTKRDLADSLLEGSSMANKLTREEMLELLRKL